MKRFLKLFLLFSLFITNSFGQITFESSFTDLAGNYVNVSDMKQTYDSGYIVAFNSPWCFMKLNKNGNTIWTKYFNNNLAVGLVLQACDGGYITSGTGISKTDSAGNPLWAKYYPAVEYGGATFKTNDCGYILACITDSFGAGGDDIYVIKTDSGGNPLWSKTYGGAGDEWPTSIQQTADGGYIIAGTSTSFNKGGNYAAYLIKTDLNGDTLWTKTYGETESLSYSAQQTYDQGYILLGDHMIKTDSNGNVMWSNTFSGNSIQQTLDTGYIFVSNNSIIKTNSSGNFLWARAFAPYAEITYLLTSILPTNDGGYIAANQVTVYLNPNDQPVYSEILKMNSNGKGACGEPNTTVTASPAGISATGTKTVVTFPVTTVIDTSLNLFIDSMITGVTCFSDAIAEVHSENAITLYPDPATNQLTIHPVGWSSNGVNTSSFHNEAVTVSIMNVLGQEALSRSLSFGEGRGEALDVSGLAAGIYFVEVVGENGRWMGKFAKE